MACSEYLWSCFVVAHLSLIGASLLALRNGRIGLSLLLGLAAVSLSGLLMAFAHRDAISKTNVRFYLTQGSFPLNEPVSFEGCAVSDSEARGEESTTTIELHAFRQKDRWVACEGKAILQSANPGLDDPSAPTADLKRGDRIRGWATWRIPHNYGNPGSPDRAGSLARRGIFIAGRVKSPRLQEIIPGDCANSWTKLAATISRRVRKSISPIKEKENGQPAAILASLTVGEYSGLGNMTREVFQNSGTFHVLVVSGLHVAWIAGLLLQFFKLLRLPERIRYVLAAAAILLYASVVGFQASITRCLWVFILYLIGRALFRRADPVNILFAAALILLGIEPDWLFEVGFQLSFLSVMAIALTAAPAINAYLKPVLEPLKHAGDPGRLFLQPGRWHKIGRNLRVRCEILVEALTDKSPAIAFRLLFLSCRGLAHAGFAVGSMIIVSAAIQLWLEPLLALNFNRMSWVSPLANLIIVPFSSVVLAAGISASMASGLPFCGSTLLDIAGRLASLLLSSATTISSISGSWQRCPTPSASWVLGGILLLFFWGIFEWRRRWIPYIYVVALLACLSCGSTPEFFALLRQNPPAGAGQISRSNLSFTFLDVGEGDSIVIRFPDGQLWLVDAGRHRLAPSQDDGAYAFDAGEAIVSPYLWHGWDTRIDRLILSHADVDHSGGMPAVMKNFKIGRLDYSKADGNETLARILSIAKEKQISSRPLQAGIEETAGPVTVRALNPPLLSNSGSSNDNSVVLQFCYKRFAALLTGDLEKTGEFKVLSQRGSLRCQLLKVAHHGSRSGTSNTLLDNTQSRWAVMSAGRFNAYHPSPETYARLLRHGVRPLLTVDEGAITFETDGTHYVLKSHVGGILERGELN